MNLHIFLGEGGGADWNIKYPSKLQPKCTISFHEYQFENAVNTCNTLNVSKILFFKS